MARMAPLMAMPIWSPKERRKIDDFILFGMAAAQQAVQDSGWMPQADADRERTGVMIGSGIGGLQTIAETALLIDKKGPAAGFRHSLFLGH